MAFQPVVLSFGSMQDFIMILNRNAPELLAEGRDQTRLEASHSDLPAAESSDALTDQLRDLAAPYGFRPMIEGVGDDCRDERIIFLTESGYRSTITIDIPPYESGSVDSVIHVIDTVLTELPGDWSHLMATGRRRMNEQPIKKVSEVLDVVKEIVREQRGFGIDPDFIPFGASILTNPATLEVYKCLADLEARMIRVLGHPDSHECIDLDLGTEDGMIHIEICYMDIAVRSRAHSQKIDPAEFSVGALGPFVRQTIIDRNARTPKLGC